MRFDKDKFMFLYSNEYGVLTAKQKEGICNLLDFIAADPAVTDIRWAAYMLATVKHECAGTWQPIAEYGKGAGKKYGIPDPKTGQTYYGRGFVQLTWRENYQAMAQVFGIDFVHEPDLVMRPEVAYQIMSYGMRKGSFTGVKLALYIHDACCDYIHARKIINGLDCADKIASYAGRIESMLRDSEIKEA
jgi:hypothetical protein